MQADGEMVRRAGGRTGRKREKEREREREREGERRKEEGWRVLSIVLRRYA